MRGDDAIKGDLSLAKNVPAKAGSPHDPVARFLQQAQNARPIDIDILAMDDVVMGAPGLTIPHPGMLERDFVLLPLTDVAPGWRYPAAGPYHHMRAADIIAVKGFALNGRLRDTGLRIDG